MNNLKLNKGLIKRTKFKSSIKTNKTFIQQIQIKKLKVQMKILKMIQNNQINLMKTRFIKIKKIFKRLNMNRENY